MKILIGIAGVLLGILGFTYKIHRNRKIDNEQLPTIFKEGFKKPFVNAYDDVIMYLKDNSYSQKLNVRSVHVKKRFWQFWRKVDYSFNKKHYEGDYQLNVETKTSANNFKLKINTNFGKLIVPFKNVWKHHQEIINSMGKND